jgi:hypothetical protein
MCSEIYSCFLDMRLLLHSPSILSLVFFLIPILASAAVQKDIPIPGTKTYPSGGKITVLPNGNFVVVDDNYSIPSGATNVGAVYLYSRVGTLISTLKGGSNDDRIGYDGITVLANGSFLIRSPWWANGNAKDAGAVTWGSATNGVTGIVSAANSLVGSTASDRVGDEEPVILSNGNFLIRTPSWDNGSAVDAGAVTWGSGTLGVRGAVGPAISLVGSKRQDNVGLVDYRTVALPNGNYLVQSPLWDNRSIEDAGAVTWGNGMTGVSGTISPENSLVGTTRQDFLGYMRTVILANGNYVVVSPDWDKPGSSFINVGAVTWGSSTAGVKGEVSAGNSLIGARGGDRLGKMDYRTPNSLTDPGITPLRNGDYVVRSPYCNYADLSGYAAGAVTWCKGNMETTGEVSPANSLMGTQSDDSVGFDGVVELAGGGIVVISTQWQNGSVADAGAVTWCPNAAATVGVVSAANSLVGSSTDDEIGNDGVKALSNGNYVVSSQNWDKGNLKDVGAVTWGSGTAGVTGPVSAANSLTGASSNDYVGDVTVLTNGHYVVGSGSWTKGSTQNVGAVTWCNGTTGLAGEVTELNSLTGSQASDSIGYRIYPLSNGNYVVASSQWKNGSVVNAGAVTWCSGSSSTAAEVSKANSLIGTKAYDEVSQVVVLPGGNYLVVTPLWDNGSTNNAGAVTWCSGTQGVSGHISATNSLVGTNTDDHVGGGGFITSSFSSVKVLKNGNYVVISPFWNYSGLMWGTYKRAGAVTWGDASKGVTGQVSDTNSLICYSEGSSSILEDEEIHFVELKDGNYLVVSRRWYDSTEDHPKDVGAVTWCSAATGRRGLVSAANSLVGTIQFRLDHVLPTEDGGYTVQSAGLHQSGSNLYDSSAITLCPPGGITGRIGPANSVVDKLTQSISNYPERYFGYDPAYRQLIVSRQGRQMVTLFKLPVAPPSVSPSSLAVPADAKDIIIYGSGFSKVPGENVVVFSGGYTGIVTQATGTQLRVTFTSWGAAGSLTATVYIRGVSVGSAVKVGVITPVISSSVRHVVNGNTYIYLHGSGFSTTLAGNKVTFPGGPAAKVTAATNTQLTIVLTGVHTGVLNAAVTVNSAPAAVHAVAAVTPIIPVVTRNTSFLSLVATTLTIYGSNFSLVPSSNIVVFSNGVTGVVSKASATQLTISGLSGLVEGSLSIVVTVDGQSSGSVQVATIIPPADGTLAFAAASYTAAQGVGVVKLKIQRQGGTSATAVKINLQGGPGSAIPPFDAAKIDLDFKDFVDAEKTINFAAGETSKEVTINLITNMSPSVPNKCFTASLESVVGGAGVAAPAQSVVKVLSVDSIKPTLTLALPSTIASTVSPLLVTGTAADLRGIDRVTVRLNGGAPVEAVLGAATPSKPIPFSLAIVPQPGSNSVEVVAYDLTGNEAIMTRSFTLTYPLTLSRVVPASATKPDSAGTVALVSVPAKSASALTSSMGISPQTSQVQAGSALKLTATAKNGYTFSHWTGLPTDAVILGNVASFGMPTQGLPVSAVFVVNPFGGVSPSFFGLLHPQVGTPSTNSTEGFLTGTLTATSGAFSGKLFIDGATHTITATFFGNGTGLFSVGSAKQPQLLVGSRRLALTYNAGSGNDQITAILSTTNSTAVSSGIIARAVYSSSAKVPSDLLNSPAKVPTKGFYTLAFLPKAQTPVMALSLYPQGYGIGTAALTNTGLVTFAASLADGTTVTCSSTITAGNVSPVFAQIQTPGGPATAKGGSFGGRLAFDNIQVETDITASNLLWFRAPTALGAKPSPATHLYSSGWPVGIRLDAVGTLYDATRNVQATLGLSDPVGSSGNAQLTFTGGKLTGPGFVIINNFTIAASTVTKLVKNDPDFDLKLTPATGAFSGAFKPTWSSPASTKPTFKGILLQKGTHRTGYGYFLSNALDDVDPESGAVILGKVP